MCLFVITKFMCNDRKDTHGPCKWASERKMWGQIWVIASQPSENAQRPLAPGTVPCWEGHSPAGFTAAGSGLPSGNSPAAHSIPDKGFATPHLSHH